MTLVFVAVATVQADRSIVLLTWSRLLLSAAVCVAASIAAGWSYEVVALVGGLVMMAMAACVATQHDPRASQCRWAVTALPWFMAGLVSAVFALLQFFGDAGGLAPWVSWAPLGEAYANLRQRNQFAALTNIALSATLAWLTTRERGQFLMPHGSVRRFLSRGAGTAMAVALLVTGNAASASRTGLLQLFVLATMHLMWRKDLRASAWFGWIAICYIVSAFALPWLAGLDPLDHGMFARLREGDSQCASRLTLWGNVLHLIAQRPVLGWGWGELDYAHFITLYGGPRFCDILDNAHNLPLHLAVELGAPVAVLFCTGVSCWVLRSKPWREPDPMRQLAWMVIAIIGIHSMLEYPLWYAPFQIALGLSLGLLIKPNAVPAVTKGPRGAWWAQLTPSVALATALFATCMYAAWDYRRISQIYLDPMARAPEYRFDTLAKIQGSWLFRRQVQFAELTTSRLTPENAQRVHELALELLHFSPEARVVEKLISSAQLLGREDEATFYLQRYRAAFPVAYDKWMERRRTFGDVAD